MVSSSKFHSTLHYIDYKYCNFSLVKNQDVNRHQHAAHSYVPTSGWYSFTCQMSDTANGLHRRTEVNSFVLNDISFMLILFAA